METLKTLLSGIDLKNPQASFDSIAEELMCNHIIQKRSYQYEIAEIEFYFYSPEYRDIITYPRDIRAGRWFFHPSGVDLTFDSFGIKYEDAWILDEDVHFGGILIRGLYRLNDKKYIFGPHKCVDELWDNFDALGISAHDEYPILKFQKASIRNLRKCKRCINILESKRIHKINEWASRLGLNRDKINIEKYADELFNENDKYLCRYFNLINYDYSTTKYIPSNARPKNMNVIR